MGKNKSRDKKAFILLSIICVVIIFIFEDMFNNIQNGYISTGTRAMVPMVMFAGIAFYYLPIRNIFIKVAVSLISFVLPYSIMWWGYYQLFIKQKNDPLWQVILYATIPYLLLVD